MQSILKKLPSKTLTKKWTPLLLSSLHTQPDPNPEKLNRIANELLSLNPVELHDYSILFRLKMGLKNAGPSTLSSGPTSAQPKTGEPEKPKEKTIFDVKLEKFDASTKIKIIKEVRSFTELGLKEAKDLVEKTPSFLKKGVTKEEGDVIVEKLKALGAVVVLE